MNSKRNPFNPPQPHRGASNSGGGSTPASGNSPTDPRAQVEALRDKITTLVDKNPRKAALLITQWMNQPATRRKSG